MRATNLKIALHCDNKKSFNIQCNTNFFYTFSAQPTLEYMKAERLKYTILWNLSHLPVFKHAIHYCASGNMAIDDNEEDKECKGR